MERVYLDDAATTAVDKTVLDKMIPFFNQNYGNSASLHEYGRIAKEAVENARDIISNKVNNKNHKLIFTSGGTESNNLVIKGLAFANKDKKHIITTKIEHDCILNSVKWLEKEFNYKVDYVPVDGKGFIQLDKLKELIRDDTLVVSIIHGNNEIGTIQNLKEIGKICHEKNTLFHSDACQSFTKVDIDLERDNIDLLTINAHKIYGPKGVGGLFIKEGIKITPLLHGGNHELGYRSGTSNVAGIVGFGQATTIITKEIIEKMTKLRDKLINSCLELEDTWLNGPKENRLPNNANISFKYAEGEAILLYLDHAGIEVSTGSACSSNSLEPSHVLTAIGLKQEDTHGTIRISISKDTTEEEIDYAIENIKKTVAKLREMNPHKY